MTSKTNKDGFIPGQLMTQADQVKYEAKKREEAKQKSQPKKAPAAKTAKPASDES